MFLLATAAAAEPEKITDIEYARVGGTPLLLDLYKPEGPPAPLLVWIHGGAWEAGSKEQMPVGALVDEGFAIASVEFRPASASPFPGQVHEIKAAIRFLRASADRYGVRAERIGILGASSGAHLATLVGVTAGHPELEGEIGEHRSQSSAVQAIVSYFGASNLATILSQSTPFGLRIREPSLARLLGGAPDTVPEITRLASPVAHVDPDDPPLLLLHGDQDPQMPINQSHELQGAYESVGLEAPLHVVHGGAHGGEAFYDARRIALVTEFLRSALR